jgi:hypothetical protein
MLTALPSGMRRIGPGTEPLYPVVRMIRLGAISISTAPMRRVKSAGATPPASAFSDKAPRAGKKRRRLISPPVLIALSVSALRNRAALQPFVGPTSAAPWPTRCWRKLARRSCTDARPA